MILIIGTISCLLGAFIIALQEKRDGRFFWRAFILGFLGFMAAFAMFYKYIAQFI